VPAEAAPPHLRFGRRRGKRRPAWASRTRPRLRPRAGRRRPAPATDPRQRSRDGWRRPALGRSTGCSARRKTLAVPNSSAPRPAWVGRLRSLPV